MLHFRRGRVNVPPNGQGIAGHLDGVPPKPERRKWQAWGWVILLLKHIARSVSADCSAGSPYCVSVARPSFAEVIPRLKQTALLRGMRGRGGRLSSSQAAVERENTRSPNNPEAGCMQTAEAY